MCSAADPSATSTIAIVPATKVTGTVRSMASYSAWKCGRDVLQEEITVANGTARIVTSAAATAEALSATRIGVAVADIVQAATDSRARAGSREPTMTGTLECASRRASPRPCWPVPPRIDTVREEFCGRMVSSSPATIASRAHCSTGSSAALHRGPQRGSRVGVESCPAAVGRPEGLRYERPPLILSCALKGSVAMISVQGVSMRFGSKVLFDDVTTTFSGRAALRPHRPQRRRQVHVHEAADRRARRRRRARSPGRRSSACCARTSSRSTRSASSTR